MPKKRITTADVYHLVQDLGVQFHNRMDSLERRMDSLEGRMDSLEGRMDSLERRMDSLEGRMDSLERRVGSLEDQFGSMRVVQDAMAARLISVEFKLDDHSKILFSLQGRVEGLHGLLEKLDLRVDRLDQEYVMITAALRRLETRFDVIEAEQLAQRIRNIELRITALEGHKA
jgi:chromosome segregation ATPase